MILNGCATDWFITSKREGKQRIVNINSNINEGEEIQIINKKGETYATLSKQNQQIGFFMDGLRPGNLKSKNLTLFACHPDYINQSFKIKRAIRKGPFIGDFILALISGGKLSPFLIVDFANNNIWKVKKDYRTIDLILRYNDSFYTRKLSDIDPSVFSSNSIDTSAINLHNIKKEVLRKNIEWDGTEELQCYYSGEKIPIPSYEPYDKKGSESLYAHLYDKIADIYVLFEWYPGLQTVFSHKSKYADMEIMTLVTAYDSLGRSCYFYSNNFSVHDGEPGPLKLLKFASKENAQAWLDGKRSSKVVHMKEEELVKKLKDYINTYPASPHIDNVQKKIYEYEYVIAISQNSLETLKNYVLSYPNSPFNPKMNKKIAKLEAILSRETLELTEYEYLMNNYLGSEFTEKYERKYLDIFFNNAIVKATSLKDLNELEREMRELEKLTGLFYTVADKTQIFELKKKYFAKEFKEKKGQKVRLDEWYSNPYYTYYKFNDKTQSERFGGYSGGRTPIDDIFLSDNKYLNGTIEVGNEVYNFKNGLLHGEYYKTNSLGEIVRKGEFKADYKNNISIPVGEHLFCYEVDDPRYYLKEIITFNDIGQATSYKKYDKDGNDLILRRFEELIAAGDKCVKENDFDCAHKEYNSVKTVGGVSRWGYGYDYAISGLILQMASRVFKIAIPIPVAYDAKILNSRIQKAKEIEVKYKAEQEKKRKEEERKKRRRIFIFFPQIHFSFFCLFFLFSS